MTTTCFRTFLQAELADRRARNARYSLRAFARHLAADHSTLSQWMRGRRRMTSGAVRALGRRLGLSERAIRLFVEYPAADGPDLGILQLAARPDFQPDSRWIARRLAISVDEANLALQRLLRFDLLTMTAAGWQVNGDEEH